MRDQTHPDYAHDDQHRDDCVIRLFGRPDIEAMMDFFTDVDAVVSRHFLATHGPDERALTEALLACLDPCGPQLHGLKLSWPQLGRQIAATGLVNIDTTLTVNPAPKEAVTRADLGIVVEFDDTISDTKWAKAMLLQAKRLYPQPKRNFRLTSRYQAFDRTQLNGLLAITSAVRGHVDRGPWANSYDPAFADCARFLLYNPPWQSLAGNDGNVIAHRQALIDNGNILDYQWGQELHRELAEGTIGSLPGGTIAVPLCVIEDAYRDAINKGVKSGNPALGDVIGRINARRCSLPWLIVLDLLAGHAGCCCHDFVRFVKGDLAALSIGDTAEQPAVPPAAVLHIIATVRTTDNGTRRR